jgi:hypothetical protein
MSEFKNSHSGGLQRNAVDAISARHILYNKRRTDLVNDLVDPICIISNANEILTSRLYRFVDKETRVYFEMIRRATLKSKTIPIFFRLLL